MNAAPHSAIALRLTVSPPHRLTTSCAKAAECYACLVATKGDQEAAALATRLCTPYLHALDLEYGATDTQNKAMRSYVKATCATCGKAASSQCSRCRLVGYCGQACQKLAWKAHKGVCAELRGS